MKLYVRLSEEAKRLLDELSDIDGVEPPKSIHRMLRKFIYEADPPVPGMTSIAAQISALRQRGHLRMGDRTLLAEELESLASTQFAFPEEPATPPEGAIEVVFVRRVEDMLPYALAFLDMQATPEFRRARGWDDLPSFVKSYVTGQWAQESARNDAREVEEEEQALYPAKKKSEPKKKD